MTENAAAPTETPAAAITGKHVIAAVRCLVLLALLAGLGVLVQARPFLVRSAPSPSRPPKGPGLAIPRFEKMMADPEAALAARRAEEEEKKRLEEEKRLAEEKARKKAEAERLLREEEARAKAEEERLAQQRAAMSERERRHAEMLEAYKKRIAAMKSRSGGGDAIASTSSGDAASAPEKRETAAASDKGKAGKSGDVAADSGEKKKVKPVDWSQKDIDGPLPRANVVIYPKHRIVLLRSYADIVRTYRGVGVPSDLSGPKASGGDRRAPMGDYYLCARVDGADGKRIAIAYPNLADADKARAAERITEPEYKRIAEALKARTLPPADTPLGGGVFLYAAPDPADGGEGFALYPEQMEELWTATVEGTPVLIR